MNCPQDRVNSTSRCAILHCIRRYPIFSSVGLYSPPAPHSHSIVSGTYTRLKMLVFS